jgi:hypothetical protein
MDSLKLAWLAGLIDGDGSVELSSQGKGRRRVPVIEVKMTCEATVRECLRIAGRGYVSKWKSIHKQQYRWRCKCGDALIVAAMVRSYVVTKRANIDMLLAIN